MSCECPTPVGSMLSSRRRLSVALALAALASALAGCRYTAPWLPEIALKSPPPAVAGWETTVVVAVGPVVDEEAIRGPYWLDSGDKVRIFVYGEADISRSALIDQQGMVAVPLIGEVPARGRTTRSLARAIAQRLGARYIKDPQVTVDVEQSRPFFVLGEVRNAGQFPFVSGLTVQTAVAVAGGYASRADERRIQITRRHADGTIEKMDVPPEYPVRPGDTLYIYGRWL